MSSLSLDDALLLPISRSNRLFAFDGTLPHETAEYTGDLNQRFSIVFFQSARGWNASADTSTRLEELGFRPAASQEDAKDFADRFERLSQGDSHVSWKLQ